MTSFIFVGPTLRPEEIEAVAPGMMLRPPVAQGDIYLAALQRPRMIGIVDGYFSGAPSVWHKEILWALSQGIQVFGSASLGALRAAELNAFGMRGIGRIFADFRDGVLEDDDEVAVVHGPAELGYLPTSEPMVNVRATLAAAEAEGVLAAEQRRILEAYAKGLFFPRRSWSAILEGSSTHGLAEAELAALRQWLPTGRIDQKRNDALTMLRAMQAAALDEPLPPSFRFEWTHFWDELTTRSRASLRPLVDQSTLADDRAIDELRLEGPTAYGRAKTRALLRMLVGQEARRRGSTPSTETMRKTLSRWQASLGLLTRAELDRWLEQNRLDVAALERLIVEETHLQSAETLSGHELRPYLLDELRLSGAYGHLADRARQKGELLAAAGRDDTDASSVTAPNPLSLRLWFFEQRLGEAMPDDLESFARGLGFESVKEFDAALHREWEYLQLR